MVNGEWIKTFFLFMIYDSRFTAFIHSPFTFTIHLSAYALHTLRPIRDRHARSFTERLQALCRMPSVAARGTGMRAVSEQVEQMLQRVGAGTRTFKMGSGFPIVYGECGAGDRCFVVYGHYDVQPVGQLTEWSSGPFAAHVADDRLYARGASNSKGDLVARLAAIEATEIFRQSARLPALHHRGRGRAREPEPLPLRRRAR